MDYFVCEYIAASGNLKSLRTAHSLGFPIYELTCEAAAISGNLDIIIWIADRLGTKPNTTRLHEFAMIADNKHIIKWLIDADSYFVLECL